MCVREGVIYIGKCMNAGGWGWQGVDYATFSAHGDISSYWSHILAYLTVLL